MTVRSDTPGTPQTPAPRWGEHVWMHVDLDAFFAQVEVLEDPALAGEPLIVG